MTITAKKIDLLKQLKLLHPFPEKVKDPHFSQLSFFDPLDGLQVKYEMLRRVNKDNWQVTQAGKLFGFSRPSFYKFYRRFNEYGLIGLLPQQGGSKRAYKIVPAMQAQIVELKKQGMSWDKTHQVITKQFGVTISLRTLQRLLNQKTMDEKKRYARQSIKLLGPIKIMKRLEIWQSTHHSASLSALKSIIFVR